MSRAHLPRPEAHGAERGGATSCVRRDERHARSALHAIEPAAVGLESFGGRSHYLERQVRRWTEQYVASATEPIDAMDALIAWLPRHLRTRRAASCTATFASRTLILHHSEPRVLAVIDWGAPATLGDP